MRLHVCYPRTKGLTTRSSLSFPRMRSATSQEFLDLDAESELAPSIRKALLQVKTEGRSSRRRVLCPDCEPWVDRSLPPHLRKTHSNEWKEWRGEFFSLAEKGYSVRKIMETFGRLFTWSVVETDLKKLAESRGRPLPVPPLSPPERWEPEHEPNTDTTIWSFPHRGNWAVHTPQYRGNWSPYVPRAIIKKHSREGQFVCDPFVGGGTTLVECWLLGRRALGVDASPHAIAYASQRLRVMMEAAKQTLISLPQVDIKLLKGDARQLPLDDDSVDLICTHPPYGPAIRYTAAVEEDLSRLSVRDFVKEIPRLAAEFHRVLRRGRVCALLVGDFKANGELVPFGWHFFYEFSKYFAPIDIIIKEQHQDSSSEF